MIVIRWVLLGLSTAGWWEVLRKRSNIHPAFLPSAAIAVQSCVLLLGGVLNILYETAFLLWLAGLVFFAKYTVEKKGKNLFCYMRTEYLFLAVSFAILAFVLQGKVFTHYDNFSHWALVVKTMLRTNHFPNTETPIITYRGYPLGSSVLAYYTARMTGGGETTWMLGQGYGMLACMLPLLRPEGRNRWLVLLTGLFLCNFFLAYNVQPTEMLVDTLLPLAGMCTLLFAQSCRGEDRRECWLAALYLIWLIQIKNAGVFFALAAGGVYLWRMRRSKVRLPAVMSVLLAFLSLWLWNLHCRYTFPSTGTSPHFLSFSWWEAAFQSKSVEDIKHIILMLIRNAFRWEYFGICMLLLAVVMGYCALAAKISRRGLAVSAGGLVGLYLFYQLGLLLTYIFSMHRTEAFYLVEFDRYEKTVIIAVVYLVCWMGMKAMAAERKRLSPIWCAVLCLMLSGIAFQYGSVPSIFTYQPYRFSTFDGLEARMWMENLKEEYQIPNEGDYAFLIEGWDSDYFYYMGTYVFNGTDIVVIERADADSLERITADYVLIHDRDNPAIQQWVHTHYPDQQGNDLIRR